MVYHRHDMRGMDQLSRPSDRLLPYLSRIRRRMQFRDGLILAQNSLWKTALVSICILITARLFPIPMPWKWALLPLVTWFFGFIGYMMFKPLNVMRVARRADAELDLKERLSTSLALDEEKNDPIYASFNQDLIDKTHDDALVALEKIDVPAAFPLTVLRRPLMASAGLLLTALLLIFLPNPMDLVIAERLEIAKETARQSKQIEELRKEIQDASNMSEEERDELLRRLDELARELRENRGDREKAMADLSNLEEALREKLDPKASQRQAALDAITAQMQALAKSPAPQIGDIDAAVEAMNKLAEQIQEMNEQERKVMAQQLSQMATRAAQAGDSSLAQALAAMSQAMMSGSQTDAQQAAQQASEAMQRASSDLANQHAFSRALSEVQNSRQAVASAGQGNQQAQGAGQSAQGQGQGQSQGQGQNQGQGQGQGQGQQAGGGGGTTANNLPPGTRPGKAGRPQGAGEDSGVSELESQVYIPREKLEASGEGEIFIPGQDTEQGETESREQQDPTIGMNNSSLVPYTAVYQTYLEAANQTIDQSYIPPGMRDYIREYFSQLEP